MPFGLTNGPSSVMPLMNLAFSGLSLTQFLRPIWSLSSSSSPPTVDVLTEKIWRRETDAYYQCYCSRRKVTFLRHIVLPDGRQITRKSRLSNAGCERASNLPKSWWFKELQGLLTPWVERAKNMSTRSNTGLGSTTAVRARPTLYRRNNGECPSRVPLTAIQEATVTSRQH